MTNSSNRRQKSSNKTFKPKDQVVDVTPLNSVDQPQTSPKIDSSSIKNFSNTKTTSLSQKQSNGSGGI